MKPTALVTATNRWFSTARLVIGLANAGFRVEAVCPVHHPLAKTSVVPRPHLYSTNSPLRSLTDAIVATKPDLIVPADDLATHDLHQLHGRERRNGKPGEAICTLIERSLGTPESFPIVERRAAVLQLAARAGVRVPETKVIESATDLQECLALFGPPVVLKADSTSGGTGVRICHTTEEAKDACQELWTAPRSSRSLRFSWLGKHFACTGLFRERTVVNAQAFVAGLDAISEVACWQGNVLASVQFQVMSKQYSGGPASVVQVTDNTEMAVAVEKTARQLGLSGLHGFDFILEKDTGKAHLIEVNPRATQVGHLTLGWGRDLPAALCAAVTQKSIRIAPKITDNPMIALFPQEWAKNRTSAYIESSYHDVPWDEPELIRACVLSCSEAKAGSSQQELWIRELRRPSALGHGASPAV